MLNSALEYHQAGLQVVPVLQMEDKSIRFRGSWKKWQTQKQTEQEVKDLFAEPCWGLAIVCTDGMEVIDIDVKHDPQRTIANQYFDEVVFMADDPQLLRKCTTVETKSGGWHIIYRADNRERNQDLAFRKESKEAVIETRGNGGLVFAAPTPGYKVRTGSYTDLPKLTDRERDFLVNSAKVLNAREVVSAPKQRQVQPKQSDKDLTPWDDYNSQHDVRDLIERYGWTELPRQENSKYYYYNKPGASSSGDVHGVVVKGENVFFTFSTATEFDSEVGYTPYGVFAVIEHSGDFSAAAKELIKQGYGAASTEKTQQESLETPSAQTESVSAFVKSTRFSIHKEYKEQKATLTLTTAGKEYKIAGPGMILGILGKKKSGKTVISNAIASSALSGRHFLGLNYQSKGMRKLFFDTEQSAFWFGKTQQRIYRMAGMHDDPHTYEAYHLRRLSVKQRLQAIDEIIKGDPVELIFLDGLVDICEDLMDSKKSKETLEHLLRWSDETNALIATVLHETKSMGFARGHLGTELENKYDHGLTVEKDQYEPNFKFKCRDSRFSPHPVVDFTRDERGWPVLLGDDMQAEQEEPEPALAYTGVDMPVADDSDDIPF